MNLVATVAVRNSRGGPGWLDLTVPRIERYANRIGAAFLEVRDSEFGDTPPGVFYAKLHAYESGQQFGFDRLLYLDADILIDNDAPDIFAELPPGKLYARRDGIEPTRGKFVAWAAREGVEIESDFVHRNAGALLMDDMHAVDLAAYTRANITDDWGAEQNNLNLWARENPESVADLPPRFNFFGTPEHNPAALFFHFVSPALKPSIETWAKHPRFN